MLCVHVVFNPSALQTNTDTWANSVEPDETARDEPSHLDLPCFPFYFWFRLKPLLSSMTQFVPIKVGKSPFQELRGEMASTTVKRISALSRFLPRNHVLRCIIYDIVHVYTSVWAATWENVPSYMCAQLKTKISLRMCRVWSESSLSPHEET